MRKVAVIGIGSNSVQMLMAEVGTEGFRRLMRDREGTRLFAGLDERRMLSGESMEKTAAAAGRMAESARKAGAEAVHIFATSASRDARNGEAFLEKVRERTGAEPEIVTGEEEAVLSFLGAADGVPEGQICGVIDIGGGSTEIVTGDSRGIGRAVSCQVGAVRLFRMIEILRKEDMAVAEAAAEDILREEWETTRGETPERWIGTGGTFTALAALVRGVPWTDRTYTQGTRLPRARIREIGEKLAGMTPEERLKLEGLQPSRADIVVHGICILLAAMKMLETEEITVSEYGNLDGYLRSHYSL